MPPSYLPTILTFLLISSTLANTNPFSFKKPSLTPSAIKPLTSKSGNVPIYKDDTGFYVAVDLQYDSSRASEPDFGPDTVPMILGLYTAQTLLVDSCLSFTSYNCEKYHCNPNPQDLYNLNYLYFTAFSYWADTNLYLDYENWGYQSASIIATSCVASTTDTFGQGRSGVLSLGTAHTGKGNFNASSPVFSILINNDSKSGELLFKKDLSYAVYDTPQAVLKADSNWNAAVYGSLQVGDQSINVNLYLIFDLATDAIGLPLKLYNQVITSLGVYGVTDCDAGSTYLPTCKFAGAKTAENLPNITIVTETTRLVIPDSIYVLSRDEQEGTVRLNLKALSNDLTGPSFVTKSYENFIVLDSRFMSYYYTVFEYKNQEETTISLYKAGTPIVKPGNEYWRIILIGSIVLLVVTIVCCCVMAMRKKKSKDFSFTGSVSGQAPFGVNSQDQGSNYQNYN